MAKIIDGLRKLTGLVKKSQELKPETVKRMERVSEAAKRAAKKN